MLIIFANSLDPDQDLQNFGPDLDPNSLNSLISSADNLCKQFGSGSKLFETL